MPVKPVCYRKIARLAVAWGKDPSRRVVFFGSGALSGQARPNMDDAIIFGCFVFVKGLLSILCLCTICFSLFAVFHPEVPMNSGTENDSDNHDGTEHAIRSLQEQVSRIQNAVDQLTNNSTPTGRKKLVRKTYPFKVPQKRVVRSDDRNTAMRITRSEMCSILGIGKDRDFANIVHAYPRILANFDEVERFCSDDTAPGPSLQDPRIYLDSPECIWNVHLAGVFARYVTEKHHNRNLSEEVVARHFLDRIECLRKVYNKCQPREDENVEDAQRRVEQDLARDSQQKRRRRRQSQVIIIFLYGWVDTDIP